MTNIINLTPHAIHIGEVTIEPSGIVPRCNEISADAGEVNGIPLIIRSYGQVSDMPEPQEDTLYIVSMLVRLALPERVDIASPGDLVRDRDGKIVGASNLVVNRW